MLTVRKGRDVEKAPPLRLQRVRVTLARLNPQAGRPYTSCIIETDPRTRADLAQAQQAVVERAADALDARVSPVLAQGGITSTRALRGLVGGKYEDILTSLARLTQRDKVVPPTKQRQPYTLIGGPRHECYPATRVLPQYYR
jgi:hypothetical protein